jgi:hypothetical protein
LLKTNEKNNINFIFSALEEMKSPIFIRLILHLLRLFPSADKKRVESYLTEKNYFNNGEIHHEYYLLMQQEFKNLPDEKQNIIFNFIDNGPKGDYYRTSDEHWTSEQKIRSWKLKKLEPIKNDLPENMKEKYKDILIQNGKEQHHWEHPDFLDYYYEVSCETVSPIEDSVMKNMPIDEIVKYLQDWRPSDKQSLRGPIVRGLAQSLEKDTKQNPQKYLDNNNILKFKEITEPIYIDYLFSALSDVDKSAPQWENIIELGLWALKQQLPKDRKRDFFEGYIDWNDTYIDMLRLFKRIYDKELQLKDETAQKLFDIISALVLVPDEYLSSRETRDDNDYYGNAVNSLHGVAVQSLVEYSLWQKQNLQKKDIENITEILNKLLSTSKYMETWAVLGRFLPWIDMMFHDWTEKNIDKILPENDRSKFDAVWITYIKYVDIFGNMFVLLESKFEYVLRNKPYKQEVRNTGEHIAVYYATGKIDLNNEIIKLLFDKPENALEKLSFIKFIGNSLKDSKVPEEIIGRFKSLWDWLIEKEKTKLGAADAETLKESKLWDWLETKLGDVNDETLEQFQSWYSCKRFERKWAIEQIHNLIVNHKVYMDMDLMEEALLEDLPNYTRKVFEIVKTLSMNNEYFDFGTQIIIEVVKYIKNNSNDSKLKKEKDDFINKFSEKSHDGPAWIDKLQEYLE